MGGYVTLAKQLLSARVDLDRVDSKLGFSALHLACRGKKFDMVKCLVEAKASLDLRTSGGQTALELAQTNKASAQLQALLQGTSQAEDKESTPPIQSVETLTKE